MFKLKSHIPKLYIRLQKIHYGKKLVLRGWPCIIRFKQAAIKMGDDCTINSEFFSNLLGLYQRTIIVARGNGSIHIGNHVGISGSTIYARDSIKIGDNTIIGANCKIIDNDFHSLDVKERRINNIVNLKTKEVTIGNDVFVGCNCIILKGSQIGDGCIIGAGSVVSGQFEKGSVIAGNPARVINKKNV